MSARRSISKVSSSSSGDVVDVGAATSAFCDEVERRLDHRQVAKPEEVHLQEPEILDAVHLVLGDDGCKGRVLAGFGLALHGQVLRERLVGDDDGRGVDAVLAAEVLQTLGDVDHLLGLRIHLVEVSQVLRGHVAVLVALDLVETGGERRVAAHDEWRHCLGDPVAHEIRLPEHPGGVAHRRPRLDRRERDDLGDMIGAVALGCVTDHLAAPAFVEVHVDVGHLLAARVQEALEEQVVSDRVDVDDAQAVRHAATRRPTRGPGPTRIPCDRA